MLSSWIEKVPFLNIEDLLIRGCTEHEILASVTKVFSRLLEPGLFFATPKVVFLLEKIE